VTTLPAPITARAPIRTPGRMIAPPPTHTSEPISTGRPDSSTRRSAASSGCSAVYIWTAGPKSEKAPMRTRHTSSTTQLKLKKTRSPSSMFAP
jgi:hypothetical protein